MAAVKTRGVSLATVRRWPATVNVETSAVPLGVSRATAYAAIRDGSYPAKTIRVGGRIRVLTASLIRVLEDGETARSA